MCKYVKAIGLVLAAALLGWTSLVYRKLRTPKMGMMWLLPKLAAGGFSVEIATIGVVGTMLGAMTGSLSILLGYALLGVAAGFPVLRIWRTPEVFTSAFGSGEPPAAGPYLVRRPWGIRLGAVPEPRVERDVPFATVPNAQGRRLLCDIWQPAAEVVPSGLALVYLHGSAWTMLDKDCGTRPLFKELVAQGHVVMDVAYRLYPETDIMGMVADAKRAVAWLKANGEKYGVDPERIVVGGGSAGGHVALLAAYTNGVPELTPEDLDSVDTSVHGALGLYSPVDLAACYTHYEVATLAKMMPQQPDWNAPPAAWMRRVFGADAERLAITDPPCGGRLDWIVGGNPEQVPDAYALLSPTMHIHASCPPTLLIQGRADIIVPPEPALEMCDKLRAAGVQAAVLLLPYADHAFDLMATQWSPSARLALWHVERFLAVMAAGARSTIANGRVVGVGADAADADRTEAAPHVSGGVIPMAH
jgi:acetyl esterase/lipase